MSTLSFDWNSASEAPNSSVATVLLGNNKSREAKECEGFPPPSYGCIYLQQPGSANSSELFLLRVNSPLPEILVGPPCIIPACSVD